jgi:hypothetical protein
MSIATISMNSGPDAYANPEETISDQLFGARYISYRNVERFLDQTDDDNLGLIVWPGGTLAETRADRFGFEFDGLQNPDNDKPTLDDMMQIAIGRDVSLSVILPTARYADDPGMIVAPLDAFLVTLLSGGHGPLPKELIFEIGSEYYANFDGPDVAAQYGAVADIMVTRIALALSDPSINLIGADITIAVQAGKTMSDDVVIREALSDYSTLAVDTLIHHRFAYQPQGIDGRIDEMNSILDAWETETGNAPDLFVSAWNTVTLTREGVLSDYIQYKAAQGVSIDRADVDLEGRTNTEFEMFWQSSLNQVAYGQEHAAYLLESFASYVEAGADMAALYGVDLIHPGRVSWQEDGITYDFVGAEMLEMIYESVGGTQVLASDGAYDPDAPATTYGFENDDKLIIFVAAGDDAPGEIALALEGLGDTYSAVWAERLIAETPDDWMAIFGVADNPNVDESPEAETFSIGYREAFAPGVHDGALSFALESPHEVVRLSFAKTDAGVADISGWAEGPSTDLTAAIGDALPLPHCDLSDDCILDEEQVSTPSEFAMIADATSSGGVLGLLLALFLFI